jgi:dihydrofolate reductase
MYIALIAKQSINGVLAKSSQDSLKWGSKADLDFFRQKTRELGVVILGSGTFANMPLAAFRGREAFILTSKPERYEEYTQENLHFVSQEPEELVNWLEQKGYTQAAVIGGGQVNQSFVRADLVREMFVTVVPQIFVGGINLVGNQPVESIGESEWELVSSEFLTESEILLRYRRS